jgi:cellulose biosynthesis protein BcsQ
LADYDIPFRPKRIARYRMDQTFEEIRELRRMHRESEIFDKAFSMMKDLLNRMEPDWKRDVEYSKIAVKVFEIMAKFRFDAMREARETYQTMYVHQLEVLRGWLGDTPKNRKEAQQMANEAAADTLMFLAEGLLTSFYQLAPLFFARGGAGALSAFESATMNMINTSNGDRFYE